MNYPVDFNHRGSLKNGREGLKNQSQKRPVTTEAQVSVMRLLIGGREPSDEAFFQKGEKWFSSSASLKEHSPADTLIFAH